MKETKQPSKKPWIYYYFIVLIGIMLFNALLAPSLLQDGLWKWATISLSK